MMRRINTKLNYFRQRLERSMYGGCAILLYHRIASLETDPQLLAVSPANFEEHLKLLKSNYRILEVEEFKDHLKNRKRFPDRCVLLTFDDGYADNFLTAMPLLEKYDSQALFYISTGTLNTEEEFWWDEVERILLLSKNLPSKLELMGNNVRGTFDTSSNEKILLTYGELLPLIRNGNASTRIDLINRLREWSGNSIQRASHRAMSYSEISAFSKSSAVVLGAHTIHHQSLAALSKEEQNEEIITSKNTIEKLTGKNIIHFSYPFGTKNDYTSETVKICKNAGLEMVCSNYPALANHHSDQYRLPRFLVRNWNQQEFKNHLETFFS